MFEELNASQFKYGSTFYCAEFESLLSKIVVCYKFMVAENVSLENDENRIRGYMLKNYLKKQTFKNRIGITDFLFDYEIPENSGRVDIRIMPVNPFISDEAYYIIECKRLDAINQNGTSGLNGQYVREGIARFVSTKYSTYYKVNGMIGFIVQSMNIGENVVAINGLLNGKLNTSRTLHYREIVPNFEFSYCSTHSIKNSEITIYHLMFDFSNQIRTSINLSTFLRQMENTSIIIYQTEDDNTKIETRVEGETVWLTQAQLCELFQKSKATISEHIKNIFEEGELDADSVVRNFRTTAADGKNYHTTYHNLDVIISVGYRVKSHQGTKFRQWATARLREYIVKGFTMNDDLLKEAGGGNYFDELLARIRDIRSSEKVFWRKVLDIYSTSIDYDPKLEISVQFFQTVQSKMHWAATDTPPPKLFINALMPKNRISA